jgi:site-specific DNA recombinase
MSKPSQMDGYVRVSRVKGRAGEGFISPAEQRDKIEGWAKLRGVEIAGWHEDLDVSGGKLDRAGLNALLARIERGDTGGVVVAKLDRLSRLGVADALKLVERIQTAGGSIAALDLGLDPTTPFGKFGTTIMLALAEMERDRLTEGWRAAQTRAIERGVKVSRRTFGYERREDGRLEPHPVESAHVQRAFALAARDVAGASAYLLAHVPTRYWTTDTTRRMLARRTYLGESAHGELVNLNAHPPLVSRAVWEAAQHVSRGRSASADYPLSGVARCATCGGPMAAGPRSSTGKRAYRCSAGQTLHKGPRCKRPAAIVADRLENYVRESVRPILDGLSVSVADGGDELAAAELARANAENELRDAMADHELRAMLGSSYREYLGSRKQAAEEANQTYRDLARQAQAQDRITSADIMDDPRELGEVLGGIVTITVEPGRGTLDDRIRLAPLDG